MAYADSKESAEYALRIHRLIEKLPPPRQVEIVQVVGTLINIEVQRWQYRQQQAAKEIRDE